MAKKAATPLQKAQSDQRHKTTPPIEIPATHNPNPRQTHHKTFHHFQAINHWVIFLFIIAATFTLGSITSNPKFIIHKLIPTNSKKTSTNITTPQTPSPINLPQPAPTATPRKIDSNQVCRPYENYKWVLTQSQASGSAQVTLTEMDNYSDGWHIARWQNYLIYISREKADPTSQWGNIEAINAINLDTNEKKVIYREESYLSITQLDIIADTLYFSTGTVGPDGKSYWMPLPFAGSPNILSNGPHGRIQKLDDQYWFTEGTGDACAGHYSHYLIDIQTKQLTHVIDTDDGCTTGESLINFDNNRLIAGYHTEIGPGANEPGEYKNVFTFSPTSPDNRQTLISEDAMPKGTQQIVYSKELQKLYLRGENQFLYDITTGLTEPLPQIPEDQRLHTWGTFWKNNKICIDQTTAIDIENKSVIDGSGICDTEAKSRQQYCQNEYNKAVEKIKGLNLPDSIEFQLFTL